MRRFAGCVVVGLVVTFAGPAGSAEAVPPGATITEFADGIANRTQPDGIAAGADGNLWFTGEYGRISRITPTGVVTQFSPGDTNWYLHGVTAGPDGNVWFTEPGTDSIGRITPAGVSTLFTAGITAGSNPWNITAGPDGNLWFTEPNRGRIGRITPAGVVTEFSDGITDSYLEDITAGPDGNLWFTDQGSDSIGRITPDGVITEFPVGGTDGSNPYAITAGPDGNLWFTSPDNDRVGRMTPLGQVTQFSAGITMGAVPLGIAAGPDGNVWFAEQNGGRIGRITPTGRITEFGDGITTGSYPTKVTAGPDGNLWFTENDEYDGNRIGRLVPPALSSAPMFSGSRHGSLSRYPTTYLSGASAAGSHVSLYTTGDCSGRAVTTGSVRQFASGGLKVAVPPNSSVTFRARAIDAAGTTSSCSTDAFTYTNDSAPPGTPTLVLSSSPGLPPNRSRLTGSAEAGSNVKVYATADCSGRALRRLSSALLGAAGLLVPTPLHVVPTFSARAWDSSGNTSGCGILPTTA